jgi:hypothetical protein
MKASNLIKILEQHPDREVILSKDSEGNGFSKCDDYFVGKYNDGEIGMESLTEKQKAEGYTDEDVMKGGVKAIVLFP